MIMKLSTCVYDLEDRSLQSTDKHKIIDEIPP